jgi:hypothetical protein
MSIFYSDGSGSVETTAIALPKVKVKVKVMLLPTTSQPVCLGVKPHLRSKTRFLLLSDSCGFFDVGHPFWRWDGSVVYNCCWLSPAQSFWVRVSRDSWPYIISQIRDSPNLEGQVPVFIPPRNRLAQLYPEALGFLFIDSQGYDGGIRTRLHTGFLPNRLVSSLYILGTDCIENTASSSYSLFRDYSLHKNGSLPWWRKNMITLPLPSNILLQAVRKL